MVEILETGSIADGFSCWDLLDSSSDSRHYHCDGRDGDDSHSKGGDDDAGDIMIMIMISHARPWCILRVIVAGIIVMVVMVMVIIAILRLGMFKMLKMIAYEMTMMAIIMRRKTN